MVPAPAPCVALLSPNLHETKGKVVHDSFPRFVSVVVSMAKGLHQTDEWNAHQVPAEWKVIMVH